MSRWKNSCRKFRKLKNTHDKYRVSGSIRKFKKNVLSFFSYARLSCLDVFWKSNLNCEIVVLSIVVSISIRDEMINDDLLHKFRYGNSSFLRLVDCSFLYKATGMIGWMSERAELLFVRIEKAIQARKNRGEPKELEVFLNPPLSCILIFSTQIYLTLSNCLQNKKFSTFQIKSYKFSS